MKKLIFPIFTLLALAFLTSSCDDSKSYAELLADENKAVNDFLVRHHVVNRIPADSVFISRREIAEKIFKESGETADSDEAYEQSIVEIMASLDKDPSKDAPYYRIDDDSNVYMQVISYGTDEKPKKDDRVYFRFTRYNMFYYVVGGDNTLIGSGNADSMNSQSTFFLFENTSVSESTQYGTGIQRPLYFLGYNSKINIVIKSQAGPESDMSYVVPYLYTITYYKSMI